MIPDMDYSRIHHSPDGTGMFLVTLPGTPDRGSYMTEQEFKDWIVSSIGGGIIPKGDILSTNLPPADASNKGWQYYCTDLNKYAISDGTDWIYFSNSPIVQTPDATDTGHALSNAVVTQCCNEVKGRLDQHDARITNLEQKAGDYSIVQYRGTNAVPTGKAKYGLVKSIVGKSRAWNQLVQNGNFESTSGWESSGATISASNNVLSFTASAQGGFVRLSSGNAVRFNKNDILLATFMIKGTSSTTIQFTCQNNNYIFNESVSVTTSWKQVTLRSNLTGGDTSGYIFFFDNRESGWDTIYIKEVCIYDLTLIFGAGNEPSTVADALAQLPALGQYNAYDAGSLVDTVVSGVKSVGVNVWDEEWEVGGLNVYSGANDPSNETIRSANYIPLVVGESYYVIIPANVTMNAILFYGESKDYLGIDAAQGMTASGTLTIPPSARFMRFQMNTAYGTTYNHDIQICLNSLPDAIKTTYHPYKSDTLSLSTPVTLKGVGTCVETLDVETGVLDDGKFGLLDLGELDYIKEEHLAVGQFRAVVDITELPKWQGALACPKFLWQSGDASYDNMMDGYMAMTNGQSLPFFRVRDSRYSAMSASDLKTAMSGVPLLYEKYIYTPSSPIEPVVDNFLEVEGGGTIDTIQTQTPVIDNCLDVGYLAV